MATSNETAQEMLREEILADARRESEEILRQARQEADARFSRATAEASKFRAERLVLAQTEAARAKELILATVSIETSRLRSARAEALLESIHEEIRTRLRARDGFDYRETLIRLAANAIARMAGEAFVVKLSPEDATALGEGLAEDVARRVERSPRQITISTNPTSQESGTLIVQEAEGRQVWNNSPLTRLERFWPELRREIAIHASLVAEGGTVRDET